MTADPEDILTNLGFAEPDLRMRIPERFLQSPSKARGIDVEWFRSSLDQDDSYGSSVGAELRNHESLSCCSFDMTIIL